MKLVLLTPSRGTISIEVRNMLLRLGHLLAKHGHHLATEDETTPGLLHHSRSVLLERLRRCDPARVRGLWLDADTHVDPRRVLWAMQRPEEVVVWAYPVRIAFDVDYPPEAMREYAVKVRTQPYRVWTVQPKMGPDGRIVRSPDGELVEILHSGFGAVLMTPRLARSVYDASGPHQRDWSGITLSSAFDHQQPPHPRSSEDVSFWRRLVEQGHRIWCDPAPYVTNGQSGGCFADEIRLRESQIPYLLAQAECC